MRFAVVQPQKSNISDNPKNAYERQSVAIKSLNQKYNISFGFNRLKEWAFFRLNADDSSGPSLRLSPLAVFSVEMRSD